MTSGSERPETRAEQLARIRRDGLHTHELELELIRAEERGAARDRALAAHRHRAMDAPALTHRVLEYLGSNKATVLQIAEGLDAGENQTDRAVRKLRLAGRIKIASRVESKAKLGRMVRVYAVA